MSDDPRQTQALQHTGMVPAGDANRSAERIFALAERSANPMEFVAEMGKFFAQSGMVGVKTPAQGTTLVLACMCESKSPFEIYREYHIMDDGKLSMRADAMMAKFEARGGKKKIIQRDENGAVVELSRNGETQKFGLSWADAQEEPFVWNKKGELKTNYATPRARTQMLWARVVSDGVRVMDPQVVAGVYTPEEMTDFGDGNSTVPTEQVEQPRRGRPPGSPNKPKPETVVSQSTVPAQSETKPAEGEVIDASYQTANANVGMAETTPLTKEQASEVNARTLVLVEIEDLYGRMGKTMADLNAAIAAKAAAPDSKTPSVKSVDDMTDEQLSVLLNNLRAASAKNG